MCGMIITFIIFISFLGFLIKFLETDFWKDFRSAENISYFINKTVENTDYFVNKISKLLNNEISWWLWTMLVFSLILLLCGFASFGSSGEIDNRTKTGYKDNEIPEAGKLGQGCLLLIISIAVFYFFWSLI